MSGLTWTHIAALAIGAGVAVTGAFAPAAASAGLFSLGSVIIGGVFGHAQGSKATP
jgi:hypothetical protein